MSADNWGICPQCKKLADNKLESAYGKVTEEEYLDLLQKGKSSTEVTNLREDYEIQTDEDGEFSVKYTCSCGSCGLRFKYEHSEQLRLKE